MMIFRINQAIVVAVILFTGLISIISAESDGVQVQAESDGNCAANANSENNDDGSCINTAAIGDEKKTETNDGDADANNGEEDDDVDEEDDDEEDDDDEGDEDEVESKHWSFQNDDDSCTNNHDDCEFWAKLNPSECDVNPDYMLKECPKACRACAKHNKYSEVDPTIDGRDLGEPQSIDDDVQGDITGKDIQDKIVESQKYMAEQIKLAVIDPEILHMCKNKDPLCTYWSMMGECDANPGYMSVNCGPACMSCKMLSIDTRCPMDRELIGPDAWEKGDLSKMFQRLTEEPYLSKYNVQIFSSPSMCDDDDEEEDDEDDKDCGPWVITMDNFVSDEEADRLIEMGSIEGYERSTDVGEMNPDGTTKEVTSETRTSTNAWCSNECIKDELVMQVTKRISNITGIPEVNSEDLQLLRYTVGQKYETHHDYIEYEVDRQEGVRMLTVFLYLNDVEAGGGTNFPDLNLTVMPKRGRVLIWPSVVDEDPSQKEFRTDHQALPVEGGIKYGANAWLHMRDFKNALDRGCA